MYPKRIESKVSLDIFDLDTQRIAEVNPEDVPMFFCGVNNLEAIEL